VRCLTNNNQCANIFVSSCIFFRCFYAASLPIEIYSPQNIPEGYFSNNEKRDRYLSMFVVCLFYQSVIEREASTWCGTRQKRVGCCRCCRWRLHFSLSNLSLVTWQILWRLLVIRIICCLMSLHLWLVSPPSGWVTVSQHIIAIFYV